MPEQLVGPYNDPDFLKLSPEAKRRVLEATDPEFAKLTPSAKAVVIDHIGGQIQPAATPAAGTELVGSTPSQIASGLIKGAGRDVAKQGLTAVQFLQYLAGRQPTPIPPSLEPASGIEQAGGTVGQIAVPAAIAALTGGASVPVQAAVGGLSSALASASSGASPLSTEAAGIVGAAAPAIQTIAPEVVASLRKGATERVASAIGPQGMKEKTALSKVIDAITAQKPIAFSSEGLLAKFQSAADKANTAFNAILAKGPTTASADQVANSINPVIDSLQINGKFVTAEDAAAAEQLMQVQDEIRALGDATGTAKMADLRALKQKYDSLIQGTSKNFNRTLAETSRAEAAKEGFFKIRDAMIAANPELKAAGKASQEAITARDILQNQELRTMTGGLGKVGDIVELGGLAASLTTGRAEPAIGAITLAALRHILASTPRKLISAAARTSLANAIESGSAQKALQIAGQIPAVAERLVNLPDELKGITGQ